MTWDELKTTAALYAAVGEGAAYGVGCPDRAVDLLRGSLHGDLFTLLPGSGVDAPDWCCCQRFFLPADCHISEVVRYSEQSSRS